MEGPPSSVEQVFTKDFPPGLKEFSLDFLNCRNQAHIVYRAESKSDDISDMLEPTDPAWAQMSKHSPVNSQTRR